MSTIISQLYTSRNILLKLLKKRGFSTEDYEGFSFNEIRILYNNNQLDMLLTTKEGKKVYVKYHVMTKLRLSYVYDWVEDLYNLEEVLTPQDELIVITKDKINDSLTKMMGDIFIKDKIFIIIFNLKQLQFNILEHSLVSPHRILSKQEENEIIKKYNIRERKQFPEISRFDPVAKALGMRPDSVCEIIRPNKSAIESKYYRLCY